VNRTPSRGGRVVVSQLDQEFVRKLAEWSANGAPVSSLYLDVDGRRYPRKQDFTVRAEELCRRLRDEAGTLDREAKRSVNQDAERMLDFFENLDRGPTRGVALFACSGADLWEEVRVPRPVKDRVTLAKHPYVLPLESLVETYEWFCTVIVDREKARLFLAYMGSLTEESEVFDDVPGKHDQGGWSQARFQRHIEEHVDKHYKHVGEVLFGFFKRRGFDHLILAGPEETVTEFERGLHDYLKQRLAARITLPITATADQVLAKSLQIEERLEEQSERSTVERLRAEAAAGRQAMLGLPKVLPALNDLRVDTLVVPFGLEAKGYRCTKCERLWTNGGRCPTCGGHLEAIPDVIESAVAAALRSGARVETISFAGPDVLGDERIGAILRF
jgi:peptide chain release factor subunit 1